MPECSVGALVALGIIALANLATQILTHRKAAAAYKEANHVNRKIARLALERKKAGRPKK